MRPLLGILAAVLLGIGIVWAGSSQQGNFPGGNATFDKIGTGTNTSATMTCGTGCSLTTSGTGSITATPAGSNTQVQFNNAGATGADAGLAYTFSGVSQLTIGGQTRTGSLLVGQNGFTSGSITVNSGAVNAGAFGTNTNCSSSASPAVCAASASGSVVVAAAATTVQVNTTAVTANSQIQLTFDSSLGTKLSVTCNTTAVQPTVSARTGGTSFTITVPSAPATNPACFSYTIVN